MKNHKDLDAWKYGIKLSKDIFLATRKYPKEETYGLVSQMRRAAVSIPSNIAEGAARSGNREFSKFLYIAAGSASELDTQIEISKATEIGDKNELTGIQADLTRISKMIYGLIRSTNK